MIWLTTELFLLTFWLAFVMPVKVLGFILEVIFGGKKHGRR